MPNPTRLLHRWPRVSEAELDAARSVTLARLTAIFEDGAEPTEDPAVALDALPGGGRGSRGAGDSRSRCALVDRCGPAGAGGAWPTTSAGRRPPNAVADVADVAAADASDGRRAGSSRARRSPSTEAFVPEVVAPNIEHDIHRNGHDPSGTIRVTPAIVVIGDHDDANGFEALRQDPVVANAPGTDLRELADDVAVSTDPDGWDLAGRRSSRSGIAASVRARPQLGDRPVAPTSTLTAETSGASRATRRSQPSPGRGRVSDPLRDRAGSNRHAPRRQPPARWPSLRRARTAPCSSSRRPRPTGAARAAGSGSS